MFARFASPCSDLVRSDESLILERALPPWLERASLTDSVVPQEPGTSDDIVCFAKKQNANFDLFEKVNVNGDDASPLWKYLKHKQGGTFGE